MFAIKFDLEDDVVIACSGEIGTVVGRWESINSAPRYLVRYRAADGRACENWWDQDAIVLATAAKAPRESEVSAADVTRRMLAIADDGLCGVTQAPDPTAGGQVDRTVAAPAQDVGDGIDF